MKKALKLTLTVEADTIEELVDFMNDAAVRIEEGETHIEFHNQEQERITGNTNLCGIALLDGEPICGTCKGTKEVTTDTWDNDSKTYQPTGTGPCPDCGYKEPDDEPSQD